MDENLVLADFPGKCPVPIEQPTVHIDRQGPQDNKGFPCKALPLSAVKDPPFIVTVPVLKYKTWIVSPLCS